MTARDTKSGLRRDAAHKPASAAKPLARLGRALERRAEEVVELVTRRSEEAGADPVQGTVRESLERIGTSATIAVARWMAGGDPRAGMDSGRQAWSAFGQLAAHRAVTLDELTKRCLRWRDALEEVLEDCAAGLKVPSATVEQAKSMGRVTLDVTLVRMCEAFEAERARTEDELARRQEELAFMATHDQLTGLPNRTLMIDRGTQMLSRARRRNGPVAALLVNLDNFKSVNDGLGHDAGDELLQAVAARLDGVLRDTDALGRIGSDEFVVLVEDISMAAGAELVSERLRGAFGAPFTVAGHEGGELTLTASIGMASGIGKTAEELLRDADIAMHRAKWEGKDRCVLFESGMQDALQDHLELEMDLRGALAREEFFLVYQPTFALRSMAPTGVEALLRWRHPTRGVVQPNDFIPLLEDTGLVVEVGRWVLHQACRQGAAWARAGHPIGVAVNVSARQLDSDKFVTDVDDAIAQSGIEPGALTLEITETTLMRDTEDTARRLRSIKALGVRIAIDDFGTGYSSLAHLQRFPVDAIKIDRSFVCQLTHNSEGETLVRTLVQLGKALSIETLAEGIEHQSELAILQEDECDSGQGFLFARPLEVHAAEAFLSRWSAEAPARVAQVAHLHGSG